jgi:signal transduction histidine kinase
MLIADPHIPARLAIVEGVSVTAHACGNDGSSSPARGIAETLNPGPDRGDSRTGHWMRTSPRKAAPPGYSIARTSPAAELGISLTETEATLAAFDRFVGGGAAVFLILAIAGGLVLSRQALRPVAESIRAARRLDPENLSERLPRTGAGDELDELAGTFNGLLDRLAAYHAQIIRFTADASHELRGPLGAMRAAVEITLQKPRESEEYRNVLASLGEQCERLTVLVNVAVHSVCMAFGA